VTLSQGLVHLVAGVDEAGRGPLAGPVVAAAVILGPGVITGLGDSKKKSPRQREILYHDIWQSAQAIGIGSASVEEIDALNIHHATLLAMRRALDGLTLRPTLVLVDGKFCPATSIRARAIVGGDGSEPAISAASIIAKVTRDRQMCELHGRYPEYGFDQHKGYPTAEHVKALQRCGVSSVHRRTFAPVRRLLNAGSCA
jgi:ribonuclease HII